MLYLKGRFTYIIIGLTLNELKRYNIYSGLWNRKGNTNLK